MEDNVFADTVVLSEEYKHRIERGSRSEPIAQGGLPEKTDTDSERYSREGNL